MHDQKQSMEKPNVLKLQVLSYMEKIAATKGRLAVGKAGWRLGKQLAVGKTVGSWENSLAVGKAVWQLGRQFGRQSDQGP
jgi:hypothetical protein